VYLSINNLRKQMKHIFIKAAFVAVIVIAITSCSKNEDDIITGQGNLEVEFDNVYGAADLVLNTQSNITSQNETLQISTVKYIVSNIVLTKEDGTTFIYPKSESYFIVDESDEATQLLELSAIPAGNYTKIKFGIGVDQPQFELGESGQGEFLLTAQNGSMFIDWTSGYKFLSLEGNFTSLTNTVASDFRVQTNKTNSSYNYTEVTLDFTNAALVRTDITPEVHIFSDVSKIMDGLNKIKFSDTPNVTDGEALSLVTQNLYSMFRVAHVHND
jgi:hypothetical protein